MAKRPTRGSDRQMNPYSRYVRGSAAYDYDYLERERKRRAEQERHHRAERERQEYLRAMQRERQQRKAAAPARRPREAQKISMLTLLGFAAAAAMVLLLLMSYAQLTAISANVVAMKKELSALEEEHIALLGRYERTFDLSAIKEAAEASGMAKPSASQIYYIDLSTPNNVVIRRGSENNVLGSVLTMVKRDAAWLVEYFK